MSEPDNLDPELLAIRNEFIDESLDGLKTATDDLVQLEQAPGNTALIDQIFRIAHSIKGSAAFFELMTLKILAHRIEDVLGALRRHELVPTRRVVGAALRGFDELSAMLSRVRSGEPEVSDQAIVNAVMAELGEALGAGLEDKSPRELPTSDRTSEDSVESSSVGDKTMRIREESIDGFFRFVGDLVVVGEMYDNLHDLLTHGADTRSVAMSLQRANESFHVLSRELQRSILEIRKVPAATLLRKAPRIVRDVATATGKEVAVTVHGDALLIDKTIVESLDAPLIHMVRNAVDHGVEPPTEREKLGKSRTGHIHITVSVSPDGVVLMVEDDGKGLDYERLRCKAMSLGLAQEGQALSEDAIVRLLFRSGVSTAEQVTDVSGRGVGMDVVKRNVEALGGKIEVRSVPGNGTQFRITVPETVSTKIINGVGVTVRGERYMLPVENVVRFLQIQPSDVSLLLGANATVLVDGQTVPLLTLAALLRLAPSTMDRESFSNGVVVLVKSVKGLLAICVDNVESSRQIVLKSLDGIDCEVDLFKGGAIMGDGTVSLVIDCDKL